MNRKRQVLVFVSVLLLSGITNSKGWATRREMEHVNRYGVVKLDRRRIKSQKDGKKEKSDKSDKSDKSGKKDKKDSKQITYYSYYNYRPIDDGFLDEDAASDLNDYFDGFYHSQSSFGSMSMDHGHSTTKSDNLLALQHIEPYDKLTSSQSEGAARPPETPMGLDGKLFSASMQADDFKITFNLYSLVFTFMDSVIPTRREDYNELVTATKSKFKDFMIRLYESDDISNLKDFEVEFVKTGVSDFEEVFIVFQSSAIFDSDSSALPENSKVQSTFGNALARDKQLWMEYITVLQELNPDNAFSSTVNVMYMEGIPNEKVNVKSTSRADKITYFAAAGITVLSIIAFVAKSSRDRLELEDPYSDEKRSISTSSDSCQSTVSETLTSVSSSICGKQNQSYFGRKDEEMGSITIGFSKNAPTDQKSRKYNGKSDSDSMTEDDSISDGLSERNRDVDNFRIVSFDDGILAHVNEESLKKNKHDKSSQPINRRRHFLQQRRSEIRIPKKIQTVATIGEDEKSALLETERLCKNGMLTNGRQFKGELVQNVLGDNLLNRSTRIEELKIRKEREILEGSLWSDEASRLDEEKRESQEKLRAELENIEAEEAARTAEELRLKEERRLGIDKESFQNDARRSEVLKLEKSKRSFVAGKRKEKIGSFKHHVGNLSEEKEKKLNQNDEEADRTGSMNED
jgi:hypothetical protein